jgi:hypothetical protein
MESIARYIELAEHELEEASALLHRPDLAQVHATRAVAYASLAQAAVVFKGRGLTFSDASA